MTTAPVDLKHTAPFVADWTALDGQLNGAQPGFVKALRRAGIERFQALGFPTPRQEAWRLTNVAPIAGTPFSLPAAPAGIGPADIQPYVYDGCARLVFLDGHFAPALSSTEGLPAGVTAGSLADAVRTQPALVEAHLGRHAGLDHPFVALNTAFVRDGAFIHVPRGAVAETPILVLFATTAADRPTVTYPRLLIVAEAASQATVIEAYAGLAERPYLTCPVTEVVVGAGAVVDHYKVQKESVAAFHVATQQIHQDRDSTFDSHAVLTGGGWCATTSGRCSTARAAIARSTACMSSPAPSTSTTRCWSSTPSRTARASSCTRASSTAGRGRCSTAASTSIPAPKRPTPCRPTAT